MGEGRYKSKSDAEAYARFHSGRKATYKAAPSGEKRFPWKIEKAPKKKPLSGLKKRLAPSAKRGRSHVTRAIKKRVTRRRR
jgi:hypothetical protein